MKELIRLIKESGLSDLKISRLTGVGRTTIWQIRNNKIGPRLSTANAITEAIENVDSDKCIFVKSCGHTPCNGFECSEYRINVT